MFIVLYADDILLISPSVCLLEKLVRICEYELDQIDMVINVLKIVLLARWPEKWCFVWCHSNLWWSCYIPWVNELRYLGIFIVRSRYFKCSLTSANKSFYRSANAIFRKIGRIAPEEATLELISSKCIPVLIYGLEACPLPKSDLLSLDFVVNRFFMKLFITNSIDIVKQCQYRFGFLYLEMYGRPN